MRISGQSILAGVAPQNVKDGKDPVVFQGLNPPGPEASIGYTFPALLIDHAMRNPHVPPGFWRGVNLNQNTIYLECFIDELAHATEAGSARLPAQADGQPSEASRRAECRRREGGLGQAGAGRRVSRPRADDGLRQLRRRVRGSLGQRPRACSRSIASSRRPIPATRSIRSRSKRRSKARSPTDCRRRSTASAR